MVLASELTHNGYNYRIEVSLCLGDLARSLDPEFKDVYNHVIYFFSSTDELITTFYLDIDKDLSEFLFESNEKMKVYIDNGFKEIDKCANIVNHLGFKLESNSKE